MDVLQGIVAHILVKSEADNYHLYTLLPTPTATTNSQSPLIVANTPIIVSGSVGALPPGHEMTLHGTWHRHPDMGTYFCAQEHVNESVCD